MDNKSYASLLKEHSDIFIRAYYSSSKICNRNTGCDSCPLYDEKMVNSHNTRCFSVLLSDYAAKLSQSAKDLVEKGQ